MSNQTIPMTGDTLTIPTPKPTSHPEGFGGRQSAFYQSPCGCKGHHNMKYAGCFLNSRTEPLLVKGKPFCPKHKNQWICVTYGGRKAIFPLGCNKWDCHYCGQGKLAKFKMRLFEAVHHAVERGDIPQGFLPWLITITWRGKRKPKYGGGFATIKACQRWQLLTNDPKQLIKDCNRDINLFLKRFKRKFGREFPWAFKVIEATKQGMPHYHMVIFMPPGLIAKHEWISWSTQTWLDITGDSDHFHTRFPNAQYTKSLKGAFGYCIKYLTKQSDAEHPFDFQGMRRYETNRNILPLGKIADISAFYTPDQELVPVVEMNREYNRVTTKVARGHNPTDDDIKIVNWIRDKRRQVIQQARFIVTDHFIAYNDPMPPILCVQYADGDIETILTARHGRRNPLDFWEQAINDHS